MSTITLTSGKKIRKEQIALVRFLPNGTDTQVYYRNGTNEALTTDYAAILSALDDGFYNFNGVDGQGTDSTYNHTRVNQMATIKAEQTGSGQVTAIVEGVGAVVQNRGDEYISSMMGIIA